MTEMNKEIPSSKINSEKLEDALDRISNAALLDTLALQENLKESTKAQNSIKAMHLQVKRELYKAFRRSEDGEPHYDSDQLKKEQIRLREETDQLHKALLKHQLFVDTFQDIVFQTQIQNNFHRCLKEASKAVMKPELRCEPEAETETVFSLMAAASTPWIRATDPLIRKFDHPLVALSTLLFIISIIIYLSVLATLCYGNNCTNEVRVIYIVEAVVEIIGQSTLEVYNENMSISSKLAKEINQTTELEREILQQRRKYRILLESIEEKWKTLSHLHGQGTLYDYPSDNPELKALEGKVAKRQERLELLVILLQNFISVSGERWGASRTLLEIMLLCDSASRQTEGNEEIFENIKRLKLAREDEKDTMTMEPFVSSTPRNKAKVTQIRHN